MIALVDCNNFFASCERLFRPELQNQPVVVLSSNDGCVVARSNEVKRLDVPMGVPYFKVKNILSQHNVHIFSSNFALYSNISQRIVAELETASPQLEIYSIDEAFLELSSLPIKDFTQWGKDLKERIQTNIGMSVSVGVAPTKTLAKLASDWSKKHSGVCVLDPADEVGYQEVLMASDVGDLWGVGRQTVRKLHGAGVRSVWQLLQTDPAWLPTIMGIKGEHLYSELCGEVRYPLEDTRQPQKSMVASRSFGDTISSMHELESAVASFTAQAAARLRKHGQLTELFGVFVRFKEGDEYATYKTLSAHLVPPTNNTSELTEVALALIKQLFREGVRYRKAGVFAYRLSSAGAEQTSLLDSKPHEVRERQKQLMQAVDAINTRFGTTTMQLASIDPSSQKWHGKHELRSPAYTTSWSQLPRVSG